MNEITMLESFAGYYRHVPPEVVVWHVQVLESKQKVIEGLARDFYQLVVVDDQMLQINQTWEVPWPKCCQTIS